MIRFVIKCYKVGSSRANLVTKRQKKKTIWIPMFGTSSQWFKEFFGFGFGFQIYKIKINYKTLSSYMAYGFSFDKVPLSLLLLLLFLCFLTHIFYFRLWVKLFSINLQFYMHRAIHRFSHNYFFVWLFRNISGFNSVFSISFIVYPNMPALTELLKFLLIIHFIF